MKPTDLVVTKWNARYRGRNLPCSVGRHGIGVKMGEGDGMTPVGEFQLCIIGVRPDRAILSSVIPQQAIGPNDIWSDDVKDPGYNLWQKRGSAGYRHEVLRRADPLYDAFGVLDFNWPNPVPGAGSAIFLHAWRKPRHPTEGCIAFDPRDLAWIFASWHNRNRVVVRG
ncbi:MAG: L,D-transpeptidase family protein [Pseudomonadota bacterium]